jgi:hypothetical protein
VKKVPVIKEMETTTLIIRLRQDGIVHCTFKENSTLDIEQQLINLNSYIVITDNKKHPFLFDAREGVWVTKEARDNAITIEHLSPVCASAIVVKTLPYKLIANFYYKFNKPKNPYKVFNNEDDAVEWLKNFIQE